MGKSAVLSVLLKSSFPDFEYLAPKREYLFPKIELKIPVLEPKLPKNEYLTLTNVIFKPFPGALNISIKLIKVIVRRRVGE